MADNASNAPRASKLIFLSQLCEQQTTSKVRFLCCVLDYDIETGHLLVEHNYAPTATHRSNTRAAVDAKLILEIVDQTCLQKGAWINVIGYIEHLPKSRSQKSRKPLNDIDILGLPRVQAVLMWNAGAIHVDKYEKTMKEILSGS